MGQKEKAFKVFDELEKGQVVIIKTYAKVDPEAFTQYAKDYIDAGGGLIFSNEYTSIRRCDSKEEVKLMIEKLEHKNDE